MATGVHKSEWNKHLATRLNQRTGDSAAMQLTYEGKRSERDIMQTPSAATETLWRGGSAANRLYYGDNLPVLASLLNDPAVRGHVRLVYIDPPFATQSVFKSRNQNDAYGDLLAGSHYVEFLRERLILLRELMADDGSIYVHLDENMAFHAKIIMDEVFGAENFRNWITRKKCNPKNYTRRTYGNVADYILFYSKGSQYVWHRALDAWTDERAAKEYPYRDAPSGRWYKKVPIHAPGVRNGATGKAWRGKSPPPGKHWQYPPATLDMMDARGEIFWSSNGNPRRKVYLDESAGVPVQDIWLDFRDAHNQNIHVTGYPTEKNPALLARIIEASSSAGDIVLDAFSGSGTTLSVASEFGRRWIGIDNSPEAVAVTLRRFAKGVERMGDFMEREPTVPKIPKTLSLFDLAKAPSALDLGPDTVRIISDFSLHAVYPRAAELDAAVAEWRSWVQRTTTNAPDNPTDK